MQPHQAQETQLWTSMSNKLGEEKAHKLKSSIWNLIRYCPNLLTTPVVLSNFIRILFCILF